MSLFPFDLKEATEKLESIVGWFAELVRGRKWVQLLLLGDVLLVAFHEILKHVPGAPKLPDWYPLLFWTMFGTIFISAIFVALRTAPRRITAWAGDLTERKAIKGLRPFGFEDAEVFARLQRDESLRECLQAIIDRDFRFGILCGESGCGKTSFLQAGLWPRLLKAAHRCVYVRFTDLDPFDSIRQALTETLQLPQEKLADADFSTLIATAATAGSQPLVLLLDQFEQFFVHHKLKEEREPFSQALAEWYKNKQQQPVPVKILLCLRGDFYDRLIELQKTMGYSLGPQQSFRLEKFTPREAAEIFRVIAETEDIPCDEKFVQELAGQELASREDGLVSAVDLQILAWMTKGQRSEEERAFTRTAYQKLGGIEGLLERFLSRALQARETESRRQAALKVLLALTDLERNVRAGVLTAEEIQEKLGGTVTQAEVQESLEWLGRGDVRLATPIERDSTHGYELAHERLIPALRRLAGKELSLADRANQLLDRRVNEWLGNNCARRYLLTRRELGLIKKQRPYLVWGTQGSLKEALLAQSRRRLRAYVWTAAFLVLFSIPGVGWWYSPWGQIWQAEREILTLSSRSKLPEALKITAASLVKFGNFERARQVAQGIDDPGVRAQVLVYTAESAAEIGQIPEATALIEQARQAAAVLAESRRKDDVMAGIAYDISRIAATNKNTALLASARRFAEGISNPKRKAWVIHTITDDSVKIGDKNETSGRLEQAAQTAEAIADPRDRTAALSDTAETAAEIGNAPRASTLLDEARQAAEAITDPRQRRLALLEAAVAAARIGNSLQVSTLVDKARQDAEAITSPWHRAELLVRTAEVAATIGNASQASALVEQARQVALEMRDPRAKDGILRSLALDTSQIALRTKGPALLESARRVAEEIEDLGIRDDALTVIVSDTARIATATKDAALIESARRTAIGFELSVNQAIGLRQLAEAMERIGDLTRALVLVNQARQITESIPDSMEKPLYLAQIALTIVDIGVHSKDAALLESALRIVPPGYNGAAIARIARFYARRGDWRQARNIAMLNTMDDFKAIALAQLLEAWAERQNPHLTKASSQ